MRHIISICLFIAIGLFSSCQKSRTIGGRVFDATTGEPIADAALTIVPLSGGQGALVSTNTSGYYAYKPDIRARGDYSIQISNLQSTAQQGGELLLPSIQYAKESDKKREYDFYIERNKRLNLRLIDTSSNSSKTYSTIFGFIYTKNQNLNGLQRKLIQPAFITSNAPVFTLAKLGWNYISGYVSTSENLMEPFLDSIFVRKPLDGIDTLTVYY
jgi:hypothetical protein